MKSTTILCFLFVWVVFTATSFAQGTIPVTVNVPEFTPQEREFTATVSIDQTNIGEVRVGSFTAVLEFDPAVLEYLGDAQFLNGFDGAINDANAAAGTISLAGVAVEGVEGIFDIFSARFRPIGEVGAESVIDLSVSAAAAITTFEDLLPQIEIAEGPFTVAEPGEVVISVNVPDNIPEGCDFLATVEVDLTELPEVLLGSFTIDLNWDPEVLEFVGDEAVLSDYTGVINTSQAEQGILRFNGARVDGQAGIFDIFQLRFLPLGSEGDTATIEVSASALAAATTFENLLPFLTLEPITFAIDRPNLLGDVNGDDLVNSTDANIILTFDAGLDLPSDPAQRIALGLGDVNGDGLTNSTDANIILTFDVQLLVDFPLGEVNCPD